MEQNNLSHVKDNKTPCPICGNVHETFITVPGDHQGDGMKLGNHIQEKVYGGTKFCYHPFFMSKDMYAILKEKDDEKLLKYILGQPARDIRYRAFCRKIKITEGDQRSGMQAHHLICNEAINKELKIIKIISFTGYSINHHKNGVFLPSNMRVACTHQVPLHRGSHGSTFVTDGGYDPSQELSKMTYVDKIKRMLNDVVKTIPKECDSYDNKKKFVENFINDMDEISQDVWGKIDGFEWTITSDGFDYEKGKRGCLNCLGLKQKRNKILKKHSSIKTNIDNARGFMSEAYKLKLERSDKCPRSLKDHFKNPKAIVSLKFKERSEPYLKEYTYK